MLRKRDHQITSSHIKSLLCNHDKQQPCNVERVQGELLMMLMPPQDARYKVISDLMPGIEHYLSSVIINVITHKQICQCSGRYIISNNRINECNYHHVYKSITGNTHNRPSWNSTQLPTCKKNDT